ncbi:MAG: DUF3365 domain-containing protein [Peptococcaceae bacterium]|nr:DUF3365 domain-containing protein [Peptococcaceae bacterium]
MGKLGLRFRLLVSVMVIVIVMAAVNIVINWLRYEEQAENQMREKAKTVTEQLISTRKFMAEKQFAINNDTNTGSFQFKHLNPAAVGKGLGDIFKDRTGYVLKQTRLKPRAPANAPDQYEIDEMEKMIAEPTLAETFHRDTSDGVQMFRYMYPLYYETSCLDCHGEPAGSLDISGYPKEGSKEGDFAGAISVMFPTQTVDADVQGNLLTQGLIWLIIILVTFLVMFFMMGRIVVRPLRALTANVDKLGGRSWEDSRIDVSKTFAEMRSLGVAFNTMSENLRRSYTTLEDTVEERTHMLREANEQLKQKGTELQRINSLLSDSDRKKSGMIAALSGELRQPLSAIIAFTQNVMENSYSHQDQIRYLDDIRGNAQMLDDQISDLMAMSQIEAGLMSLDYTEFKVEDVFKDLRKIVNPIVERKGLKLSVDIDSATSSLVADEKKVVHILRNLLSNAVKYTPEGGWIRVKVEPASREDGQDMILIQVSDSGIGIKPEDLSSLFTQMWQGEQGSQGGQDNHGLGLAIVKILIELHGGTIDVKSIWQKGTLFSIRIPGGLEQF